MTSSHRSRVGARKARQWSCPRFISVVCGSNCKKTLKNCAHSVKRSSIYFFHLLQRRGYITLLKKSWIPIHERIGAWYIDVIMCQQSLSIHIHVLTFFLPTTWPTLNAHCSVPTTLRLKGSIQAKTAQLHDRFPSFQTACCSLFLKSRQKFLTLSIQT